ncbi:hypothetical protein LGL08_20200 [Clostridium estertheticum]|uniref:hypothetical protein n=1 Tax=Clostridium estertheticum TaxID=238834 RepID=UPI001CF22989|nr:hypothetical protein [Clostridium estertheticum]MCB2309028.1 hypothetical protein [Clostridium estertheticum]MCB2346838.1 hypothetical protein [Clostridium estertheticum]MCB2351850.1 hypothetical protein [Clostridium estertheticum]WAG48453.1 hypothetical protein LL127_23005 [Clostridium estertheticum]
MNILDVLWKLGYDVISFNEDGEYKVQFGLERQKRHGYDHMTYTIKVKEVSFNKLGNLVVDFTEVAEDNCFDVFEYKNMSADELY